MKFNAHERFSATLILKSYKECYACFNNPIICLVQRVVNDLPKELVATEVEVNVSLLGNQGPEIPSCTSSSLAKPLTSRTGCIVVCTQAILLTHFNPFAMFLASRRATCQLVVRLHFGLLAHYALDRIVHPFVYSQQDALIGGGTISQKCLQESSILLSKRIWIHIFLGTCATLPLRFFPPAEVLKPLNPPNTGALLAAAPGL